MQTKLVTDIISFAFKNEFNSVANNKLLAKLDRCCISDHLYTCN